MFFGAHSFVSLQTQHADEGPKPYQLPESFPGRTGREGQEDSSRVRNRQNAGGMLGV